MRLAFLGTPVVSAAALRKLVAAGHDVAIVITRPDKRRSRNASPEASPVKVAAQELGLAVSHNMDDVLDANVEMAVVVAFGRLIPNHHLDTLEYLNIHPSLLPRWRGAAPVQHTILSGDAETGVCVMRLVQAMDEGPLYAVRKSSVGERETADELLVRLLNDGSDLLVECLADGLGEPKPQEGQATYAPKIEPVDLRIDWSASAHEIDRKVRVGKAWTTFRDKRLVVESVEPVEGDSTIPGAVSGNCVETGKGLIRLLWVRPEGKPSRSGQEWSNGARLGASERLV